MNVFIVYWHPEPKSFNGAILRPIHRGMLQFVGFDVLSPQIVYGPARMSPEDRTTALNRYRDRLLALAEEVPIAVGRY